MKLLKISFTALLLFFSFSTFFVPMANAIVCARTSSKNSIQIFPDENGIRIVAGDIELYFNATNGGEITEYFDLTVDPSHSKNLANIEWKPYYNLLPLFVSAFYNPYSGGEFSTGGDSSAMVKLIASTSEYVILQTSSRIMSRWGAIAKDAFGNAIYVNSTWILRNSGLFSVERTFFVPYYATIPVGWRWYPFYLTRRSGFNDNGTFYMFNTTYAYVSIVNEATYRNVFGLFPLLPNDTRRIFGIALPFSNTSIGGDGAHTMLIAYDYDELVNVNEWRTDNYHSKTNDVIESGAVHEFSEAINISTHTYHMILNFTHQPIDKESVQGFANYYADNTSLALLMECLVTTNKDLYKPRDYYTINGCGVSYYNLISLTGRLTVKNSSNRIVYQRNYGPANITAGQSHNVTLSAGTLGSNSVPDNYIVSFQIFSPVGIVVTSSSKVITIAGS